MMKLILNGVKKITEFDLIRSFNLDVEALLESRNQTYIINFIGDDSFTLHMFITQLNHVLSL